MSCCEFEWYEDQVLPALGLMWSEQVGENPAALIDFSSGWTFSGVFVKPGSSTIVRTKSTGFVGGDGGMLDADPNLVVNWAAPDFADLAGSRQVRYQFKVTATRISDGFLRDFTDVYVTIKKRPT